MVYVCPDKYILHYASIKKHMHVSLFYIHKNIDFPRHTCIIQPKVQPMTYADIIQQRFNYPTAPTDYQLGALKLMLNSPYSKTEPLFAVLAAYFILCSRQFLPDELEKFLPKNIKSYSIDPSHLYPEPDTGFIKDYIDRVIAPDFSEIKGTFFKLGGMSAKTKQLTRAASLDNIYNALCNSDRYRLEYQFSHVLNLPIYLFFNQELRDAKTEKEIRVMIKDNQIQGISSYKMNGPHTYSPNFISSAIEFLNNTVLPKTISWQQDFVIDVLERRNHDIQIIEFNPYYTSMPCFYGDWANIGKPFIIEDDRYNATKKLKEIMSRPLPFLTR